MAPCQPALAAAAGRRFLRGDDLKYVPPDRITMDASGAGGGIGPGVARFGGWDTAINLRKNSGHQVRGRFENFNVAVRVGGACKGVRITGAFTRGQIGVYVEAGARNVLFDPVFVSSDVQQPFVVEEPHSSVRMVY